MKSKNPLIFHQKREFSLYVRHFFKLTLLEDFKYIFEDELKELSTRFDVDLNEPPFKNDKEKEEVINNQKNKFENLFRNEIEKIKVIFSSDIPNKELFENKDNGLFYYKKIILMCFIKTKYPFILKELSEVSERSEVSDRSERKKEISSLPLSFSSLYNILLFRTRLNSPYSSDIIKKHIIKCKCDSFVYNDEKKSIYKKYIYPFKDVYLNYKKYNKKEKEDLFTIFFNLSLLYENTHLYAYLPIYFLNDIFGLQIKKRCCYYCVLYECMLLPNRVGLAFPQSGKVAFEGDGEKNSISPFSFFIPLSKYPPETVKIKDLGILEKIHFLNIFEEEKKEGAVNEILFSSKENHLDYQQKCGIFGAIYNFKHRINFTEQMDYVEKIEERDEENELGERSETRERSDQREEENERGDEAEFFLKNKSNKSCSYITFYNFKSGLFTTISKDELIFGSDLTISYMPSSNNSSNNSNSIPLPIPLSKYSVEKIKHLFDYDIMENERQFMYDINLAIDYNKFKKLFSSLLSGKNRNENFLENITEEEKEFLGKIVCFSKKNENEEIYYKNNKEMNELIFSENESDKLILQNMCKYFLKKK